MNMLMIMMMMMMMMVVGGGDNAVDDDDDGGGDDDDADDDDDGGGGGGDGDDDERKLCFTVAWSGPRAPLWVAMPCGDHSGPIGVVAAATRRPSGPSPSFVKVGARPGLGPRFGW